MPDGPGKSVEYGLGLCVAVMMRMCAIVSMHMLLFPMGMFKNGSILENVHMCFFHVYFLLQISVKEQRCRIIDV